MKSRDFCYWLQGLFELAEPGTLDEKQVQTIRNHLNMVFYHEIDPSYGGKEVQLVLDKLHSGGHNVVNSETRWGDAEESRHV